MNSRRLQAGLVVAALCTAVALPASGAVPPKKKKRVPATIKACANVKTGALRVRKRRACRKGERPLVWGVRGPRGLRGARGAAGARGPAGGSGSDGGGAAALFTARATAYSSVINPAYASVTGATQVTVTEAEVETLGPATAFTAGDLAVRASAAPAPGASITVTIRANGSDTSLACTVAAGGTSCSNTSASASIPAGSALSLQVSSTGTILTTNLLVGFRGR